MGDHRRLHDLLLELRRQSGEPSLRRVNSACGVSVGHLSQIFRGMTAPGPDVAVKIAQALHATERQQARMRFLAEGIEADRSAQRAGGARRDRRPGWDGCPYRGLLPFEEQHARVFYGRRALTRRLLERLRDRPAGAGPLLVLGPSGAGKSSLLRAGLMGSLAEDTLVPGCRFWPRRVITPTADPVRHLAVHLAELAGADAITVREALHARPDQAHLLVGQALAAANCSRMVLVVDQLEELFTLGCDTADQQRFLTALHSMATGPALPDGRPGALVIGGIRGDFLDQAIAHPTVRQSAETGIFAVGAMSESELREAITGPAAETGARVPDDLATAVLDDLRERSLPTGFDSGALPLLSQVMFVMWQTGTPDGLTVAGYRRTGGVADIVRTSAEQVFSRLDAGQQHIARSLFVHLTAVTGGRLNRRPCTRAALRAATGSGEADLLVEMFAAQRLLTVADNDLVTIAHEELLNSWDRLRDWLQPSVTDQELHRALTDDVQNWQQRHHDPSYLYQGGRLVAVAGAVRRWTDDPGRHLRVDPGTVEFLAAGHRRARRRRHAYRTVAATMAVLLVLTGGAALLATRNAARADRQHVLALSRQLAALSRTTGTDRVTAEQLAAAALHTAETDEALAAAGVLLADSRTVLPGASQAVEFSPVGGLLATGGDGSARLWDPGTGQPVGAPLTGHIGPVWEVTFSPDGKRLATASEGGTVRLWDPGTGQPVGAPLTRQTGPVMDATFSPDGKLLVTAGDDGTVRLWDPATGSQVGAPLPGSWPAAFSPDGKRLATGGEDDTVRLWDVETRRPIGAPMTGSVAAAFSPDGSLLATGGNDGTARFRDPRTGRPVGAPLTGHTGSVDAVVFSPDSKRLVTRSSEDGVARIWRPRTGQPVGAPLLNTMAMAFSPDGKLLATSGFGVRLWDPRTGKLVRSPLPDHDFDLVSVAFSPDGKQVAAAGDMVRLWDSASGRPVGEPLTGSWPVAFSPDGRLLATGGSRDGTVQLWDPRTGRPAGTPLTGHTGTVAGGANRPFASAVAFSRDGTMLAIATATMIDSDAGGLDGATQVWDLALRRPVGAVLPGASSMAFSPDGTMLAAGGLDGTVRLWEPRTGRPVGAPLIGASPVAFSPDGTLLAGGGSDGRSVQLWEPRTGRPVRALTGHDLSLSAVAFSPDGRLLATGGEDSTVQLWDPTSMRGVGAPSIRHHGPVRSVAFSPDGKLLVPVGTTYDDADGPVRLWDPRTGRVVGAPLSGQLERPVTGVAFSPDGRLLATADDATVRLWNPSTYRDPLASLCSRVGSLSTEKLRSSIAGEPDLQVCP